MGNVTRTLSIASLEITPAFLKDLSDAVERDARKRNATAQKKIAELIREEESNLDARAPYLTREERMRQLTWIAKQITQNNKPNYQISYIIHTKHAAFTFHSYLEMLAPGAISGSVRAMSVVVEHFDARFVSFRMEMRQPFGLFDRAECSIEGEDEKQVVERARELEAVFTKHRTGYRWMFMPRSSPYLLQKTCSFFLAIGLNLVIGNHLALLFLPISAWHINTLIIASLSIALPAYVWFRWVLARIYPYYAFRLVPEVDRRRSIAVGWLGAVLLAMIGMLLYQTGARRWMMLMTSFWKGLR